LPEYNLRGEGSSMMSTSNSVSLNKKPSRKLSAKPQTKENKSEKEVKKQETATLVRIPKIN
jgi:hypothetical protein